MAQFTVSICIPTCNRPGLLREALHSCVEQTRKPDCILVGDDSANDATERMVWEFATGTHVPIDYKRNVPPLRQSANTNSLFDRTTTTHLMLLHDDDLLLPNAVEDLLACWAEYPNLTAAFGKQIVVSHDGADDLPGSEGLNRAYFRSSEWAGLQANSWEVGVRQQFPNNGYMVLAATARAVRWRSEGEVGNAGDFDFGLRLGLTQEGFFFLDKYTTKVRLTESGSISTSSHDDASLHCYTLLEQCQLPAAGGEQLRSKRMAEVAPRAMMQAVLHGHCKRAWEIYVSPYHGWRQRLSLGGIRRIFLLGLQAAGLWWQA